MQLINQEKMEQDLLVWVSCSFQVRQAVASAGEEHKTSQWPEMVLFCASWRGQGKGNSENQWLLQWMEC